MSIKNYFTLISIVTAVCWLGWFIVLMFINPQLSGWLGFAFFYSSLYLSLVGTFMIIGFGARILIRKEEIIFRHIKVTLRQAILLALFAIVVLILQSQRYLFWWNSILLILFFSLIEVFFLSFNRFNTKK